MRASAIAAAVAIFSPLVVLPSTATYAFQQNMARALKSIGQAVSCILPIVKGFKRENSQEKKSLQRQGTSGKLGGSETGTSVPLPGHHLTVWNHVVAAASTALQRVTALQTICEGSKALQDDSGIDRFVDDSGIDRFIGKSFMPVFQLALAHMSATCASLSEAVHESSNPNPCWLQLALRLWHGHEPRTRRFNDIKLALSATHKKGVLEYRYRIWLSKRRKRIEILDTTRLSSLMFTVRLTHGICDALEDLESALEAALYDKRAADHHIASQGLAVSSTPLPKTTAEVEIRIDSRTEGEVQDAGQRADAQGDDERPNKNTPSKSRFTLSREMCTCLQWIQTYLLLLFGIPVLLGIIDTLVYQLPRSIRTAGGVRGVLQDRNIQAGVKYFCALNLVMLLTLGLAGRGDVVGMTVRDHNVYYGYITAAVALAPRVEATFTNGLFYIMGTSIGGTFAMLVMRYESLASNPYGISALLFPATFIIGLFATGHYKRHVAVNLVMMHSLILCQYKIDCDPAVQKCVGDTGYYAARVLSVTIGASIAIVMGNFILPWRTTDWAMETLGHNLQLAAAAAKVTVESFARREAEFLDQNMHRTGTTAQSGIMPATSPEAHPSATQETHPSATPKTHPSATPGITSPPVSDFADAGDDTTQSNRETSEAGGPPTHAGDDTTLSNREISEAGGPPTHAGDDTTKSNRLTSKAGGPPTHAGDDTTQSNRETSEAGGPPTHAGDDTTQSNRETSKAGGPPTHAAGVYGDTMHASISAETRRDSGAGTAGVSGDTICASSLAKPRRDSGARTARDGGSCDVCTTSGVTHGAGGGGLNTASAEAHVGKWSSGDVGVASGATHGVGGGGLPTSSAAAHLVSWSSGDVGMNSAAAGHGASGVCKAPGGASTDGGLPVLSPFSAESQRPLAPAGAVDSATPRQSIDLLATGSRLSIPNWLNVSVSMLSEVLPQILRQEFIMLDRLTMLLFTLRESLSTGSYSGHIFFLVLLPLHDHLEAIMKHTTSMVDCAARILRGDSTLEAHDHLSEVIDQLEKARVKGRDIHKGLRRDRVMDIWRIETPNAQFVDDAVHVYSFLFTIGMFYDKITEKLGLAEDPVVVPKGEEVLKQCYGQKCDMWSAGVLAYELLCAQLPFRG
eukprot:gene28058-31160_t